MIGLLAALMMIAVCWLAATMIRGGKLTVWVSGHNFTLYIFSWFFQAAMMAVCGRMNIGWILTFFLMFLAGVIGPAIVLFIYERTKFLQLQTIKLILGIR